MLPHPTSVRIGTVTFKVTSDRDDWMQIEHATQKKGYYGHTDPKAATIYLSPETALEQTRLTLWHEVLHALHETVMGSPSWQGLSEDAREAEERVVLRWEHPTLAVLRDNPDLVAYLVD
jgi:hypothetical protein